MSSQMVMFAEQNEPADDDSTIEPSNQRRLDFVADWDPGGWKIVTADGALLNAVREDFLSTDFWSRFRGRRGGIEMAHLKPRSKEANASLSQIYYAEELEKLAAILAKADVKIALLPERMTKRILSATDLDKDSDHEAHLRFFNSALGGTGDGRSGVSLQFFPWKRHEARCRRIDEIVSQSNIRLNTWRARGYDEPAVIQWITRMFESRIWPESFRKVFQIERKKAGLEFNRSRVMSIYSLMFDSDNRLYMANGRFVGVDTIWRALGQHHYRGRGGVARSNVMHHLRSSFVGKDDHVAKQRQDWAKVRPEIKRLIKALRDAALEDGR